MRLRDFGDTETTRYMIHKSILDGFKESFPKEGKKVRLRLEDLSIQDKYFTKEDQKKAIIGDKDLTVPLKGTMILEDIATNKVLEKKKMSLGQVLHYTPKRGTFIGNGTEFSVANQMRLRPGTYTRIKSNDDIETQFNTAGKLGFRVAMEPKTGVFRMAVGNNKLRLYPILKSLNVSDSELEKTWGKNLLKVNLSDDKTAPERLYKKLSGYNYDEKLSPQEKSRYVVNEFKGLKLDPEVTKDTLGEEFKHVTPRSLLKATDRIIGVYKGTQNADDRDSLKYKTFHGVEDFIKERITKDAGKLSKKLMYKLDKTQSLDKVQPGYFSKYLKQIVRGDSRAYPLEEINPIQLHESLHRNIVTGEGGIGSMDLVSNDSRDVNPTQLGFIDPIRGPESEGIGIDTRIAYNTFKGDDKKIYSRFINTKTGKAEYLSPSEVHSKVIAFPDEMDKKDKKIIAMEDGKIKYIKKDKVDYKIEDPGEVYSVYSLMIPGLSASAGARQFMAGKAYSDTLPFEHPEAPIVRSKMGKTDTDYETHFGKKALTELSPDDGTINKVSDKEIILTNKQGKKVKVDLYHNFPLSRKTYMKSVSNVKIGDKIKKGDILAHSNYTDKNGTLAAGKHLTAAYWPYKGLTFEDGIVISESGSKKLTSEQMYKIEVPLDENTFVDKKKYISSFPSLFNKEQINKIDLNGLPKPGLIMQKGDPLILGIRRKTLSAEDLALGNLHKSLKNAHTDIASTWDYDEDGEVTDVIITGKKAKVYVKTKTPARVGDKLSGRYGNKGVISKVVADAEMPIVERTGERLEMALNPAGVTGRQNPSQIHEGLLGKIGKEKGTIYRLPLTMKGSYVDYVESELKKNGIPDKEMVVDNEGRRIPLMVTNPYFFKLSKLAKSMFSARETGGYTSDLQPAKGSRGGKGGAMKMGAMELAALLGHGAKHNLREISTIKGQKNDDIWRNVRLGYPMQQPETPFVFGKFLSMLKASGINTEKKGDVIQIKPLTDKDVSSLSNGEIRNSKFLSSKDLSPEKGGFFDIGLTGGVAGNLWTHMNLPENMPSPVAEMPIRSILGVNEKEYRKIISGETTIGGKIGGDGIKQILSKIEVPKAIEETKQSLNNAPKSKRDQFIKKLKYLKGLRASGVKPQDLVISKIPVLPPIYRPIAAVPGGSVIVSDPNKLYQDLYHTNKAFSDLKKDLPPEMLTTERLNLYDSLKATAGLGEHVNPEFKQTGVKSFIKKIVGDSPKTGYFFDKVISKRQDLTGRAVVVPGPDLGIDDVGIPDKMAWTIFRPFIMKELVRRGFSAVNADEAIEAKNIYAQNALDKIVKERPVIINRAPTLHKFSMMGVYAKPKKGHAISVSPLLVAPFNLDHDGDAMQVYVPSTDEAVQEVKDKMLPSKNLKSTQDYRVHYVPQHDDNFGLYLASTKDKKNKPIVVKNLNDLKEKMRLNNISFDDRISIRDI